MHRLLLSILIVLVSTSTIAQPDLTGRWEGYLKILGNELPVALNIPDSNSRESATLDIIGQGVYGIPFSKVELRYQQVYLECDSIGLNIKAILQEDSLYGKWFQNGLRGKFASSRKAFSGDMIFPFRLDSVIIPIGDFNLSGSLSYPDGDGPYPLILLINGSGQQDRDENILGFKVFQELALELNKEGWAVFRYDDRGIGNSGGFHDSMTTATFVGDVHIILDSLNSHPELQFGPKGIIGHSEGGIIAGNVARNRSDIDFIVLMAGPTLPGKDIILLQTADIMEANNARPKAIDKAIETSEKLFIMMEKDDWEGMKEVFRKEALRTWLILPRASKKNYENADAFAEYMADLKLDAMRSAWYQYFISYDPILDLEALEIPVLAVFGGKDRQVPATENITALKEKGLLGQASKIEIATIPDANHLFQKANTGSPNEYASLDKNFDPEYIRVLMNWLREQQ